MFSNLSAAITQKIYVAAPDITYSVCCQRYGKGSFNSGKSGRIRAVPETMPPGIPYSIVLLTPNADVIECAPTPVTRDVFDPGWQPST